MNKTSSLRAARSSLLIMAALVGVASAASAQTAPPAAPVAPAAAPAAPAAPAAAPEAAAPAAPAAEAAPAPAAPVVTAEVNTGFPVPAASPASAEVAMGTVAVAAPAPAPTSDADPNGAAVTFKPGKGVDIKSADGNFLLNTRLRLQFLDELRAPSAEGSKVRNYAVLRRVRMTLGGHLFSENIKFKLDIALGTPELGRDPSTVANKTDVNKQAVNEDGNTVVLSTAGDVLQQGPIVDAYMDFTHVRDANVHVGQGKVPYSLESLYSDGDLRSVDRTVASAEFGLDRDIGIDFRSQDFLGIDKLRYYAGVYSGEGRNATIKSAGGGDVGLLYVVRAEILPLGSFELYEAPDVAVSSDAKVALGVAYAFLQADATSLQAKQPLGTVLGAPDAQALVDFNSHNFTADLTFKLQGLSAMTAFYFRKVNPFPDARDGFGWSLQAGYVVSQDVPVEVQAGFAMIRPTDGGTSRIDETNELGGGFNYYFHRHALKVQAEYAHTWDQRYSGEGINRIRVQLQAAL